jgi:GDP-L-fucose synthase
VIPALIKKCHEAIVTGARSLTVWGTGRATREFLYVKDAADGIVLAAAQYDGEEPVNLGSGSEISIHDLVDMIAQLMGYRGEIVFDASKPDGQPRRCLDTSRARQYFGFDARTSLEEGLTQTIAWYRERCAVGPTRLPSLP